MIDKNMDITMSQKGNTVKLTVKGHIDHISLCELQYELEDALSYECKEIILNMTMVNFMCANGIKIIHEFNERVIESGLKFSIERPSEVVRNVLGKSELEVLIKK